MIAAKHVLRYVKGTIDYELCFKKCNGDFDSVLAYPIVAPLYHGNQEGNLLLLFPLVKPSI